MATNHTKSQSAGKAVKPYPTFPLSIHGPTQRYYKKIRGRRHYFGSLKDGWQAALDHYNSQAGDLHAGRTPRATGEGLTVLDLCNQFLTAKHLQKESGELAAVSFRDYYAACQEVLQAFGKTQRVGDLAADDFRALRAHYAKRLGAVSVGNKVRLVRILFRWAYDNALIDRPVRWGTEFKAPSKKTLRLARRRRPVRLFTPAEVRAMLRATVSKPKLHAMIWLGINGALGNRDVGDLPIHAVDFENGLMDYPRGKTGLDRRCVLWPETIEGLRAVLGNRRQPRAEADKGLLFITRFGLPYVRVQPSQKEQRDGRQLTTVIDGVALEFNKLLDELKIDRQGVGFYSLRHCFRSWADDWPDRPAVDLAMGHAPDPRYMGSVYSHDVSSDRLAGLSAHVRAKLGDWTKPD